MMMMSVMQVRFNKEMVMAYFKVRFGILLETLRTTTRNLLRMSNILAKISTGYINLLRIRV
jgi:hypothetical protein